MDVPLLEVQCLVNYLFGSLIFKGKLFVLACDIIKIAEQ